MIRPNKQPKTSKPPRKEEKSRSPFPKPSPPDSGNVRRKRHPPLGRGALEQAKKVIDSLHGDKKERTRKGRLTSAEEEEWATSMAAASSIFVNPNAKYEFRLCSVATIISTGAGGINTAITWNPAAISEYSTYLQYLFAEVRIVHAKMSLVPINTTQSAAGIQPAFIWASNLLHTNAQPASFAAVMDNADSTIHPSVNIPAGRGGQGAFVKDRAVPRDYLWGDVSDPVSAGVNTGCYGQFELSGVDVFALTQEFASYMFEGWYEFRSRD